MRPRKVESSNIVYRLPGGTEDNDLHARLGRLADGHVNLDERDPADGTNAPYIATVYEPTNDERAALSSGISNVEVILLGLERPPPLIVRTTTEHPRGKPLTHGDEGDGVQRFVWAAMPLELIGILLDLSNPDASDSVRAALTLEPDVKQWRETLEAGYRDGRAQEEEPDG